MARRCQVESAARREYVGRDGAARAANDGDTDARHVQFFRPALDIASLFEAAFALEQQGKVRADGMPA